MIVPFTARTDFKRHAGPTRPTASLRNRNRDMAIFEILLGLLGLLAACVALALVARRLNIPVVVVLVVGGMMLGPDPGPAHG